MEGRYLKPIMASPLWHRERCPAGGKRILANTLIRFIPFPPNPAASWAPSTSHLLLHRKESCDLIKAMRFWGFSGGCLFSVPALAWHRCLAIQSGSRKLPVLPRKETPTKHKAFSPQSPISMEVGSLQELPSVVWHPPPLSGISIPWDPCCHRFLPFSPLGISTFSSPDRACVPTPPSFSFLPLSSGTHIPPLWTKLNS